MLILSRKADDRVVLPELFDSNGNKFQLTVQVTAVKGERVRLGFSAPSNVRILRSEVYESMKGLSLSGSSDQSTPLKTGKAAG